MLQQPPWGKASCSNVGGGPDIRRRDYEEEEGTKNGKNGKRLQESNAIEERIEECATLAVPNPEDGPT